MPLSYRAARKMLEECAICPRRCGVNRLEGGRGYCRAGDSARVYSYLAHRGEEPAISGRKGSGTIFFSQCNMKCVYCQNHSFSQLDQGRDVTIEELAGIMLELQAKGCHNINLVTPTHAMPALVGAWHAARAKGLKLPIVYNTGGYELQSVVEALRGIVDIYLVDMRYSDDGMAVAYSGAPGYVGYNRSAVLAMQRQVGDLAIDGSGIARRGLIIRLLVLPGKVAGTVETLRWIAAEMSNRVHVSIMSQYFPNYRAAEFAPIARPITPSEYEEVVCEAHRLGLDDGWIQAIPEGVDSRFAGTHIKPFSREA